VRFRVPAFPADAGSTRTPWRRGAAEAAALQGRFLGNARAVVCPPERHSKMAICAGMPPGSGSTSRAFDADRASAGVLGRVRRDVDSGIASGQVRGTPTLFIDGVVHRGGYDTATLLAALAR